MMLDAYSADRLPAHLLTAELFEIAARRLESGGAVGMNLVAAPGSDLAASVAATVASRFPEVLIFDASPEQPYDQARNLIFVAGDDVAPAASCLRGVERGLGMAPGTLRGGEIRLSGGHVYRDDHPPVAIVPTS